MFSSKTGVLQTILRHGSSSAIPKLVSLTFKFQEIAAQVGVEVDEQLAALINCLQSEAGIEVVNGRSVTGSSVNPITIFKKCKNLGGDR